MGQFTGVGTGRGGSRWGAGRPGWKGRVEDCLGLDVRKLNRKGFLHAGASCTWGWQRNGHSIGTVTLNGSPYSVWVECTINGKPAGHTLNISRTACNYGGARPWFLCPICHRRAALLYLRGNAPFRCRECAQLAYASQSEDDTGRAWRRELKISANLGEDGGKPKGMHWATYDRLMAQIEACELRRETALAQAFRRLLA